MNGIYLAVLVATAVLALVVVPYCFVRARRAREPDDESRGVERGWQGWDWNDPTWDRVWRR